VGQFARFLIDIQNELGPFKAMISHSFGTGCSVIANSWGLEVEKLVLVAGPAKYDVMITNYVQRIKLSPKAKLYFYQSLALKSGLNPKDINIGQIGSKLATPVLVVHDKDDKAVNYNSALTLKSEWTSLEILTTEGLGHRRILKDKHVTSRVADFIAKPIKV
jgi:predicted alpha/beta hydrolase family esterase